ncbi:MAG: ornithine cyclodeaminase family protein [Caldilineaceae bacterium]|nr:ornithine cyclodeaminase family protein [Caldilineaceae bacterium]
MTLYLTSADVKAALSMDETIEAMEAGFRQLAQGRVEMPQRGATPIRPHNGLHLSMPAYVGGDVDSLTVKIVTVYGDNPANLDLPAIQGVVLLHDARTGTLLAIMDAERLTAMRTGAVSGVATRYLAREDASMLTIFGAGAQAFAQVEAVCAVRPIEQVLVVTRTGVKDLAFCINLESRLNVQALPCDDIRMGVESADIICTATNAVEPLFNGNWVQEGAHINAVGAYTATMRELDTHLMARARVVVDYHPAARTEAGDILIPLALGELTYDHVAGDLGEVLTGQAAGRRSAADVTVFKSVGLAMQDAVTAPIVYRNAVALGLGQKL